MIDSLATTNAGSISVQAGLLRPTDIGMHASRLAGVGIRLSRQFALLVGVFYAGSALVQVTHVPLPGNLVGMLLLLALLRIGVVRLEQVQDVASLLVKHLNLFFLPMAVGLMGWGGLLGESGVGLAICLAGSVAVGLFAAGRLSQALVSGEAPANA